MLNQEDKICLIHKYRTYLLNRMFDQLSRKAPGSCAEHVSREIVATAKLIQNALAKS